MAHSAERKRAMDNCGVERAAKLLAKAQSTAYEPEAIALMEKSCRLLTGVIAAAEAVGQCVHTLGTRGVGKDPSIAYCQLAEDPRPQGAGHIDLRA